jgi:hypothetical protein
LALTELSVLDIVDIDRSPPQEEARHHTAGSAAEAAAAATPHTHAGALEASATLAARAGDGCGSSSSTLVDASLESGTARPAAALTLEGTIALTTERLRYDLDRPVGVGATIIDM